ncbi:MAG: 30S ribosomal protein S2 [Candidatus Bathyarchaeota archaeon]|nr:MAG: 30S ribosomal protein S2 [Candidatus Bathyarchaeota archaeon]
MSEEIDELDVNKSGEEKPVAGDGLLLPIETLLSAGIHIGTKIKTKDMEPFIYRVRPDGLFVLDIKKTDERLRMSAKFIARFDALKVVVTSSRLYGRTPVQKFCEKTHSVPIVGRFLPGLFSNPIHSNHLEPDILMVTDPKADKQAVKEAALIGIPVIAICDTDNDFSNIDFVIPANNKGRRALATIYWLLARQILRAKGELPPDGDLSTPIEDFETKLIVTTNQDFESE